MSELSRNFKTCARDILQEAVGKEPPSDWYTGLMEQMIQEIVKPSGRVKESFTLEALRSSAALAHGQARELTDDEIKGVIRRHFDLKP